MAEGLLKITRGVPRTDREWNDVFAVLNRFLKFQGGELIIGGDISLPEQSVGTDELQDDSVTNAKLRDSAALSLMGQPGNTGGNPSDIISTVADTFMVRRGSALTWDALEDGDIPASIARDADVSAAITAHEGASDPHPGYTTAAELSAALSALNLASGVYTPTVTGVTNVDATTAYSCQYLRVGATVTVSGRVDVDTAAAVATEVRISLPIASDLANANECTGVASASAVQMSAPIRGDATNNAAVLDYVAVDTANRALWFTFTYRII